MAKGDYEETSAHMDTVVSAAKAVVTGVMDDDIDVVRAERINKRLLRLAVVVQNVCAACKQTLARVEALERAVEECTEAQKRTFACIGVNVLGTETDVLGGK